jgi:hypothetical protein
MKVTFGRAEGAGWEPTRRKGDHAMKKKATTKRDLKLKLQRETLRTLVTPELALAAAGATSTCRSGRTCCNATCACP